jgi:hypothetical protein
MCDLEKGQCQVGEGSVRLVKEKAYVPTKNNILVQASKILPIISPIYGVNPSISQCHVRDILSENKKWENKTCESVKWLKCAKLEDLEDELVIWIGQVNVKNRKSNEVIKKKQQYLVSR